MALMLDSQSVAKQLQAGGGGFSPGFGLDPMFALLFGSFFSDALRSSPLGQAAQAAFRRDPQTGRMLSSPFENFINELRIQHELRRLGPEATALYYGRGGGPLLSSREQIVLGNRFGSPTRRNTLPGF